MERSKVSNSELRALGVSGSEMLAVFSRIANKLLTRKMLAKSEIMINLESLIKDPESYAMKGDDWFKDLAELAVSMKKRGKFRKPDEGSLSMKEGNVNFPVWGMRQIEEGALAQMRIAMRLPVTLAGALMPDAHQGYGLPIGGVLATEVNKVIPYAVGVDIACRMCLSIFDLPATSVDSMSDKLKNLLLNNTYFGMGCVSGSHFDSTLFDNKIWNETRLIRSLKDKAYAQLGTSGTGNHFVEWGELTIGDGALADLPAGNYLALLSHSGSRGFGGAVAGHYSRIAMTRSRLPAPARHLAWLDLNEEEGQEYWIAMNLAGEYASANHREIHNKIARALGAKPIAMVENHHNFAWRERLADGTEAIVHRKGATPAGDGVLGIIPGSMSAPGFLVRGKGNTDSINSASHGAGRTMSRSAAFKTLNRADVAAALSDKRITLIGSDVDEAPMVYKDIGAVMAAQEDLVEVLARFEPRIVRMASPREIPED